MRWLRLIAAALLLFFAIWVVVPAPNLALLAFGVGGPEISPIVLAISLVVTALLTFGLRASRVNQVAWLGALAATILSALPLARLPATIREFDQAMSAAIGSTPSASGTGQDGRPSPVILRDLVFGLERPVVREGHDITIATVEGEALTIDIYQPVAAGRVPVLVQIYGGAWQRGAPGDQPAFARYFASRGFVVFAIDYRHAPRWQWPAQIDDVRTALEWIRTNAITYGADLTRMALIGRSAGAHLAMMAAYMEGAPPVSAVVNFYGPTDLAEGWRDLPQPDPLNVRSVLEAFLGGTPDQMPDRYRDASPITFASATSPPTLLLYGARDHIVMPRFGRMIHERLRSAGAVSILLELPWAEHGFDYLPGGLGGQVSLYYIERFLGWALRPRG